MSWERLQQKKKTSSRAQGQCDGLGGRYRHRTTRSDALQAGVTEKDTPKCKTFVLRKGDAPQAHPEMAHFGIGAAHAAGAGGTAGNATAGGIAGSTSGLTFLSLIPTSKKKSEAKVAAAAVHTTGASSSAVGKASAVQMIKTNNVSAGKSKSTKQQVSAGKGGGGATAKAKKKVRGVGKKGTS
jgi:hypothetical protein